MRNINQKLNNISKRSALSERQREAIRLVAKELAKEANERRIDILATSIQGMERTHNFSDDSWVNYGFIMPEDILFDYDPIQTEWEAYLSLTPDEIQEYVDEVMTIHSYSNYDCTGKVFTRFINWHRNPCGLISFEHYMGMDI